MTSSLPGTTARDSGAAGPPLVNTHVHLPPNFSAFDDVASVVERARSEGIVALGTANYFDYRVYRPFAEAAAAAGIAPLHGMEIISVQEDLRAGGVLVNDPANPGRTYLCGKGIAGFDAPRPAAAALMATIRETSEARIREMAARVADCARDAGLSEMPAVDGIVAIVATRNGVPAAWVSLQERHLARALQEAVFAEVPPEGRAAAFERLLGVGVDPAILDDPTGLQEMTRSRLMKAGKPAFVAEAAVSFDDAFRLVLELDGIPCYPTLADGANPVCPFEDPAETLAETLVARGIYLAELIPTRNAPHVVDRYVAAFRSAGILVLGGTEHNTRRMIPLAPTCVGGVPLSGAVRGAFWEGACVVAAHQHLRSTGRGGYVDATGGLASGFPDGESRIRWFRELGEQVIGVATGSEVLA